MRNHWRILAVPLIAAGVATAIVVSTSTQVAPSSPTRPATPMALTADDGTLVATVTPEGLAMAPDWLKPCLSQGIKVQPPNTPYPTLGSGIQLPNPPWQGFDCHILDNQLVVPNWIDPNDTYGSIVQHIDPQDRSQLEPLLQQAQKQVGEQEQQQGQPEEQPEEQPQEQSDGDLLSQLIQTLLQWLKDYGWIVVALAVVSGIIGVGVQKLQAGDDDGTGCNKALLRAWWAILKSKPKVNDETRGLGYDDDKNTYQLSSRTADSIYMAGVKDSDSADLVALTEQHLRLAVSRNRLDRYAANGLEKHVETKMATYMYVHNVKHVCLVIDHVQGPCPVNASNPPDKGCRAAVPELLDRSEILDVYWGSTVANLNHDRFVGQRPVGP